VARLQAHKQSFTPSGSGRVLVFQFVCPPRRRAAVHKGLFRGPVTAPLANLIAYHCADDLSAGRPPQPTPLVAFNRFSERNTTISNSASSTRRRPHSSHVNIKTSAGNRRKEDVDLRWHAARDFVSLGFIIATIATYVAPAEWPGPLARRTIRARRAALS
jgi:hypothetical protein